MNNKTYPLYHCSKCGKGFDSHLDMAFIAFGHPTNIYSKGVDVCKGCSRQPKPPVTYYGLELTDKKWTCN